MDDANDSRTMSKPIPTIQKYMSTSPHSITIDQPLKKASALMREHSIRHLPVLDGSKLVGMITERDISLLESMVDLDPAKVTVEDAMSSGVYSVSPDAPLDEVVATMGEHKYGSVVVMQNDKVVGIFTTVDVCRAFSALLTTRLSK